MEHEFWLERWRQQQTGFHLSDVNPRLAQHASALPDVAGQRVLVPLCGKTVDMAWLAERGLRVLGVELSSLAAEAFFTERNWTPIVTQAGPFTRYAANNVEILCGDFFALDPTIAGELHGFYDRAAVIALPPLMRRAYADHLATLMPATSRGLLIAFEYPQHEMDGPPFSVPEREVHALFESAFRIDRLASYDILKDEPRMRDRGLTQLREHAFALLRSAPLTP
jgi:thiopurine S-methyltransferase